MVSGAYELLKVVKEHIFTDDNKTKHKITALCQQKNT